jgi:hypothetical protein
MKKTWLMTLGFLLFTLGITSLTMTLIGARWAFLGFLESNAVPMLGFLLKIGMILAGVVCVVLSNIDWEKERAESSNDANLDN